MTCRSLFTDIITGIFILIAYISRLERYLIFIPSSVIHGFTLGVALIIALNQLNFAFGLSAIPIHETFMKNMVESLLHLPEMAFSAFLVFTLFLSSLFVLLMLRPTFPGIIIIAPFGIVLGYCAGTGVLPLTLATLETKFGFIEGKLIELPTLCFDSSMVTTGIAVAIVAILETMISAKIADRMTKTTHDERKEMLGLGLANIASGFLGGIPATAALARTALNVRSGATHKIAQGISSIVTAVISLFFLKYFSYMPLAVIAAILVFVAARMIEREHFLHLWHEERHSFWLALLVAALCLLEDPIVGIFAGTAASFIMQARRGNA